MNETKSMGLRLPVQAGVDRTATYATLAQGAGVEASQLPSWLTGIIQNAPGILSTIGQIASLF
jgi:hypothetical protein